jgi:O-acetylserine/cysteine efflux transporter
VQRLPEAPVGGLAVVLERHRNVDLEWEAGRGRVEPGRHAPHDAGLLETADAVQGCRGREPDQAGQLHVGAVGVGLELLEQAQINQIKRNRHLTKYSIVLSPNCQIQLEFRAVLTILISVNSQNRNAIVCIAAAAVLWGLNVPLTKLALGWLGPGWVTVVRFAVAAPVLALVGRRGLREALAPGILASGAVGFGAVIVLQNVGIERTSVSHAAVVIGAIPVLVALIGAGLGQSTTRSLTWVGYGVALVGIAFVAGSAGGGSSSHGDVIVFGSAALSAGFIVAQPRLLAGRDAAAVTALQFAGGALVAVPFALLTEGLPHGPAGPTPALALAALALAGTPLPFWLFAFGQARVSAELAGAFLNLEPVVGVAAGWLALGEPATGGQILGALAVLAGIAMSTAPARLASEDERVLARVRRYATARLTG